MFPSHGAQPKKKPDVSHQPGDVFHLLRFRRSGSSKEGKKWIQGSFLRHAKFELPAG